MSGRAMTPREVADELGVTVRTVQRWIADGRLQAERVGGRFRVSRSSLADVADVARTATGPLATVAAAEARFRAGRPIRSLLIANRGEIAERIARTAAALGVRTIAVHEADDRPPTGVDLARRIPGYLDGEAIIDAARAAGADAIHPGYGFLSENPGFADAVRGAGLTWVGPPAAAIAAMGDKAAARRVAVAHGVPVLPGYDGADQADATLEGAARRIGLPILVKPAAGGGGKGMRVIRTLEGLSEAIAGARREARRAFGDDRLLLERLLERPRHVEVQVLFDEHESGVHLGERDCSAQRRNQKVVEEAPAPAVDAGLRARMGEAALRVGRAVGYANAGTVEFLLAEDGDFYFLEMNTRLQVEHPVTEAVTGRDLVADQLRLAAGEALGLVQDDIRPSGHAIEARLYAEDPEGGFLPATGRLLRVRWPAGARVDAGVHEGDEVSDRYDPLLAKLIVHRATRDEALAALGDALMETELLGVRNNLRFLRWLTRHPVMAAAEVRTDTIASLALPEPPILDEAAWLSAAEATAGGLLPDGPWGGGWRLNAAPVVHLQRGTEVRRVELVPGVRGQRPVVALDPPAGALHVDVHGQSVEVRPAAAPSVEEAARQAAAHGQEAAVLTAPMPGRVIAVRAGEGERVAAHAPVVVLEAMKMEHAVLAPLAGTLTRLAVAVGQQVQRGEVLAEMSA